MKHPKKSRGENLTLSQSILMQSKNPAMVISILLKAFYYLLYQGGLISKIYFFSRNKK